MQLRRFILPAGLVLIALLAAVQVIYSTRLGAWAESDSAVYLAAARNLLAGDGLRVLQPSGKAATLMPPLYSLTLAGLGALGADLLVAARWLNAALIFASILLFGWICLAFGRTRWLALPGALLLAVFPPVIELYSGMMTEPLYLTLMLFGFGALLAYFAHGTRGWLVAAALSAGLGAVTRFVGIVFLPAGALAVVLLTRHSFKRRLGDLLTFTIVSVLPLAVWAAWLYFNPDSSPALGSPQWTNPWAYLAPVRNGIFQTLWAWLPFGEPHDTKLLRAGTLLALALLPVLAALGAWRLLGKRLLTWLDDPDARLAGLAALSIGCFFIGFILIYLFRNPPQDVNNRTLLPLFPLLLFLVVAVASLWLRLIRGVASVATQVAVGVFLLACCAGYLPANLATARSLHANGRGYITPAWQNSPTIQALQDVPAGLTLISNENGALLYFSGRTALEMSERFRKEPATEFTRFGDDSEEDVQVLFRQGKAALVVFRQPLYWQLEPLYGQQTDERIGGLLAGLKPLFEGSDGSIYLYP